MFMGDLDGADAFFSEALDRSIDRYRPPGGVGTPEPGPISFFLGDATAPSNAHRAGRDFHALATSAG